MKLGSLFSGIGGFEYAASLNGITPVWASEIEPAAVSITRRHFPDMKHLGDITQINGAEIEPVDIITFGSPCQDLSVAGKRAGLAGARSGLFGEAIRIIEEMRGKTDDRYPTWVVWENVPGALSSGNGLDFRAVLQSFANTEIPMPDSGRWASAGMVRGGRCDIAWRILDAQYFGVPQRRRRIFLVADFRGRRAAEVLFKSESLRWDFAPGGEARQKTAGDAGNGLAPANDNADQRPDVGEACGVIDMQGGKGHGNYSIDVVPTLCADSNIHAVAFGVNSQGNGEARISREVHGTLTTGGSQAGQGYPCVMTALAWPEVTGTLCASDAGLNRPAGQGNETDLCVVSAGSNGWRSETGTIEYEEDRAPCVRASMPPKVLTAGFMAGQGAKAGGIGYQEDMAPTLKAAASGGVGLQDINPVCVAHGQAGAEICENLSPTLNCNHEQPYIAGNGYIVRRLMPRECEALQGFPRDWTAYDADGKVISDSRRYAAIGNSVAIPCVDYVMAGIKEQG